MIPLAGGEDFNCAEYATFGSEELSNNVIKALDNRSACLMSNHGQVAFGKNLDQRNKIIEYSLKLNSTNLSPLRSGNISMRSKEAEKDGYLITPSGKKYESLKPKDIVFMGLNEEEKKNGSENKPSSEWRFHRDIYINKKNAEAIVHAHSPHATAVSSHSNSIPPIH